MTNQFLSRITFSASALLTLTNLSLASSTLDDVSNLDSKVVFAGKVQSSHLFCETQPIKKLRRNAENYIKNAQFLDASSIYDDILNMKDRTDQDLSKHSKLIYFN